MKLPYRWLEQYIDSPGKPQAIAEALTLSGSSVEKISYLPAGLSSVVVAEILEILPHPNADRLQLVKVAFEKQKTTDVVCGASNIAVGQKVPLALPGTTLPNGAKLAITKIRGVESRGMLCAEDELGLGEDHNGILILDARTTVGTMLPKALGLSEAIFDVEVTSNRGDCLSIEGLAREYAAASGKRMKTPKIPSLPAPKRKTVSVTLAPKIGCTAYYACRVSNIVVGPSPIWLQSALREAGMRPINNIVDITNYVMFATGQPMHAFDVEKISSKGKTDIAVRYAKTGEQIVALDDTDYVLDKETMVITDAKNPIAIAGVIGGKHSAVTEKTKEILIEVASFDSTLIRRTALRHGIRTESSARFEKGINSDGISRALSYALSLIKETTGGTVEELVIQGDKKSRDAKKISVSYDHVAAIAGVDIPKTRIKKILTSLGFSVKDGSKNTAVIGIPSFRRDVGIEEDVIEEIVRMYGVNNLPPATIKMEVTAPAADRTKALHDALRHVMVAHGFYEVSLYSFYGDKDRKADSLSMFCDGRYDHLEVKKPLSPEQRFIRKSLLPGILKSVAKNIRFFPNEPLKIFELGKVFIPQGAALPDERWVLAAGMTFLKTGVENQLLYAKGVVESILRAASTTMHYEVRGLHDRGIVFEVAGKPIAMVYALSSQEQSTYKLKKPSVLMEVSLSMVSQHAGAAPSYTQYSPYPSITRDLAIEVEQKVLWGDVQKLLKSEFLEMSSFLSQYPLEEKKSLAFRMVFRSMKETLVSSDVEKEVARIAKLLKEKLHATIRGE